MTDDATYRKMKQERDMALAECERLRADAERYRRLSEDLDTANGREVKNAILEPGNLTTKREKVILLSRAQKENESLRAKIATQELRLEDAYGLLRYVADQRDAEAREQMREELLAKVRPQSIVADGLKLLLKELP